MLWLLFDGHSRLVSAVLQKQYNIPWRSCGFLPVEGFLGRGGGGPQRPARVPESWDDPWPRVITF